MLCSPVTRLPESGAVKSRVDQFGEKVQRNLQSHLGVPHRLWPSRFVAQGQSPGADGMRRPVSPGGCDMLPGRRTPVGANKETSHEEDYHCFVAVRAAEDKPDQTRWQGDAA